MMKDFCMPNYKNGSIVNLMSSISKNFGKKHSYNSLPNLPHEELKKYKNIVLIVIDGLGYNYLMKQKDSFLFKNLKSKMTSVFLATTVCANTTFMTGYPPQQHALTGWDMNLKEIGCVTTILPFVPRYGDENLSNSNVNMDKIMEFPSFHKGFNAKCYTFIDKRLAPSPFTIYVFRKTKIIPTISYNNIFLKIKETLKKKSAKRRFLHAYISEFDSSSHRDGVSSSKTKKIFLDLDKRIKSFVNSIKGTNTKVIIVSDHGFVDIDKKHEIFIEDIKGFKDCLTLPLSGEPRVRYCYVRPDKVKDFKKIIRKLRNICWCYKGKDLINNGFYGLGKPNPKLFDRVGDYVLIMKKPYTLRDRLANSGKYKFKPGKHAGVSGDEMLVPLIVVDVQ